ncbi:MAG: C2H2-type zinc finger protein [Candidatus Babeliales bacterium]
MKTLFTNFTLLLFLCATSMSSAMEEAIEGLLALSTAPANPQTTAMILAAQAPISAAADSVSQAQIGTKKRNVERSEETSTQSSIYKKRKIVAARKAEQELSSAYPGNQARQATESTKDSEKSYSCDQCGKGFTSKNGLKYHIKTHTGERPFKCKHPGCSKDFLSNGSLKIHVRTHTGKRPFKCTKCGKDFAQKCGLTQHIKTHTKEQAYVCIHPGCGEKYTQSHSLKKHSKVHTEESGIYKCATCGAGYGKKANLTAHIGRAHIPKSSASVSLAQTTGQSAHTTYAYFPAAATLMPQFPLPISLYFALLASSAPMHTHYHSHSHYHAPSLAQGSVEQAGGQTQLSEQAVAPAISYPRGGESLSMPDAGNAHVKPPEKTREDGNL